MMYGEEGVRTDPDKVQGLEYITPPQNREELMRFYV